MFTRAEMRRNGWKHDVVGLQTSSSHTASQPSVFRNDSVGLNLSAPHFDCSCGHQRGQNTVEEISQSRLRFAVLADTEQLNQDPSIQRHNRQWW